jgi:hypothetical protein
LGETESREESFLEEGHGAMDVQKLSIKDIKIDPLATDLATSEEAQPYLDYFMKAYRNDSVGLEIALKTLQGLPLEKRYTWRVFSALKWAFADFDDECVRLDLPSISEAKRSEMAKELELRFLQMQMLLRVFQSEQEGSPQHTPISEK